MLIVGVRHRSIINEFFLHYYIHLFRVTYCEHKIHFMLTYYVYSFKNETNFTVFSFKMYIIIFLNQT